MRGLIPWVVAVLAFWAFTRFGATLAPWAFDWPRAAILPAARWITAFTKWLLNEAHFGLFTFQDMTRAIAAVIEAPYRVVTGLLSEGFAGLPPLPWIAVIGLAGLLGHRAGGWPLALLVSGCFQIGRAHV